MLKNLQELKSSVEENDEFQEQKIHQLELEISNLKKLNNEEVEEKMKILDLAFLYAEPIVEEG